MLPQQAFGGALRNLRFKPGLLIEQQAQVFDPIEHRHLRRAQSRAAQLSAIRSCGRQPTDGFGSSALSRNRKELYELRLDLLSRGRD